MILTDYSEIARTGRGVRRLVHPVDTLATIVVEGQQARLHLKRLQKEAEEAADEEDDEFPVDPNAPLTLPTEEQLTAATLKTQYVT